MHYKISNDHLATRPETEKWIKPKIKQFLTKKKTSSSVGTTTIIA
jgi:hypothetical protein